MANKAQVCEGIADMVTEHLAGDLPDLFNHEPWTELAWGSDILSREGTDYFLVEVDGDWFRVSVSKAHRDTVRIGFR